MDGESKIGKTKRFLTRVLVGILAPFIAIYIGVKTLREEFNI